MCGAECLADMLRAMASPTFSTCPAVLRKTFAVMDSRTAIKRLHVHGEGRRLHGGRLSARASGKPGICTAAVIGALNFRRRPATMPGSPIRR